MASGFCIVVRMFLDMPPAIASINDPPSPLPLKSALPHLPLQLPFLCGGKSVHLRFINPDPACDPAPFPPPAQPNSTQAAPHGTYTPVP